MPPPRPRGIERNVVVTLWDWGTDHSFMHDQVSTSKQNPTVNGGGRVYAVSAGHGTLVVLDPNTNETSEIEIPTRQARAEVPSRFTPPNPPSLWWGSERLWNGPTYNTADPHNPMLDSKGRVWLTSKIRANRTRMVRRRRNQQVRCLVRPGERWTAGVLLRSQDPEVPVDRNLLRDAPSAVRQ